jgi:hypothetical protein
MSEQVLPQTKGFLQAVDNCTGELLVVCPPMVPAKKMLVCGPMSLDETLLEHVLFFEFLIA